MTTTTIQLFTLTDNGNNSNNNGGDEPLSDMVQLYRDFLRKQGHRDVPETDLATEPDLYHDLRQRFPRLHLPGILLNGTIWVHGDDARELQAAWGKAWFDHVLHAADTDDDDDDKEHDDIVEVEEEEEEEEEASLQYVPAPLQSSTTPTQQQVLNQSMRSNASSTPSSLYTSPSTASSQLASIPLPNGTQVEMGALIRLLMRATHHSTAVQDGKRFFYFRGFEGLELWSILFFEDQHADVTDFGRMLIDRGIVHNYSPKCTDFAKTFLVLQPLKEPRVLNSFIQWPSGAEGENQTTLSPSTTPNEDPMDVLLRLSRLMDDICASDYRANLHLYHEFEIGCCQLQVLPWPTDQRERITFVLNLYNMAVRHAVICCDERQWSWPTDLESLQAFFLKTGYNVNGEWKSIAELQAILFDNLELPPLVSKQPRFWKRWSLCRPGNAATAVNASSSRFYGDRIIYTDPRLLFAMTLGIKASPSVATVYPDQLDETLQTATQIYARENLTITNQGVVLPAFMSWFRHDLGDGTPEMVLHALLPLLSEDEMHALGELWRANIMDVKFGSDENDWKPSLRTLASPVSSSKKGQTQRAKAPTPRETSSSIPKHKEGSVAPKSLAGIHRKKATHLLEEFSLSPSPELMDPASELIDPTPLLSPPSLASNTKHQPPTKSSSFSRQPSFQQKSGVLLRRLWGRYPSVGDFAPRRPGMVDKTETQYDDDDDEEDYDDLDDGGLSEDGYSFFQSVVSEITYGSEFQDLLSGRSKRRLQTGRR